MTQLNSPTKRTDENAQEMVQLNQHLGQQKHSMVGEYVKSAVYGGLDGAITTLVVALSGIGSSTAAHVILALGFSSLLGNAISMAFADYLGTKSDLQFMEVQEQREKQQIEADLEGQKRQMHIIYEQLGLAPDVATQIVDILVQNKEGFLKVMMIEQLQMISGEENPIRNSLITFFSFCIFGLMPLIPIIVAKTHDVETPGKQYLIAVILVSAFFLFVLGFGKSFVTNVKWYWSSLQTLVIGAISAGAAFGIGKALGE